MSSKEQKQRPRLGRGLSSLMALSQAEPVGTASSAATEPVNPPAVHRSESAETPSTPLASLDSVPGTAPRVMEIALDQIVPNPHQPRRHFDETMLAQLAASLKTTGLVQPVIVREVLSGFELIAGERRWRAARLAGLATLPAIVRRVDSVAQAEMALVENIQRENLNPVERAEAYQTLMTRLELTQAELAIRLGEERSSVANHLRLLTLTPAVLEMVRTEQLSLGHAKLLASITDAAEQQRLADLVSAQELSVRNLERVISEVPATPKVRPVAASAHLQDLEKNLARQLGMRVQVRSTAKRGTGRLVIHYNSLDQFDELLGRLGVKADE